MFTLGEQCLPALLSRQDAIDLERLAFAFRYDLQPARRFAGKHGGQQALRGAFCKERRLVVAAAESDKAYTVGPYDLAAAFEGAGERIERSQIAVQVPVI